MIVFLFRSNKHTVRSFERQVLRSTLSTMNCNFIYFGRPYWRCYYANTDAVIYVVDSADRDRIGICKQELLSMLEVNYNKVIFSLII